MRLGREGRACDTGCKPIVKYMFAPEQCSVNTPSNLEKTSTSLRSSRQTSRILKDITFSSWRDIFALIGNSRAPNMIWYDIIGGESARTWSILCTLVPKASPNSSSSRKVPCETTWGSAGWEGQIRWTLLYLLLLTSFSSSATPKLGLEIKWKSGKKRSLVAPSLPASISWQNYSHSPPESHHASWKLKVLSEYLQYLSTQPIYVQILW